MIGDPGGHIGTEVHGMNGKPTLDLSQTYRGIREEAHEHR